MVEFEGPVPNSSYFSKFYIIGDRAFVSKPDDLGTAHSELRDEAEAALGESEELPEVDRSLDDAGIVMVTVEGGPPAIELEGYSPTLHVPAAGMAAKARAHSATVFERLSPGYEVIAMPPLS